MSELKKLRLGDYITQRREKNTSDNLPICGVCKEGLIPPKQQDADISLYNVFYKNDFIFNPARMELNSITLNNVHEKAICSSLYEIFYINDTTKLLPEFLFVQLKTDNFVRFCKFQGQGSVREYCRFADISEYPVIVPDIKEQQKIVDTYNAITNRIQIKQKINENLEKTAQCLFDKYFSNEIDQIKLEKKISNWNFKKLGEVASFIYGKMADDSIKVESGYPIYSGYHNVGYSKEYMFKNRQIVVLARGVSGTGEVRLSPEYCYLTNLSIAVLLNNTNYFYYFYYYLKNDNLRSLDSGSAQSQITVTNLENHKVVVPPENIASDFNKRIDVIIKTIYTNEKEIEKLINLKQVIVSQISKR